ncbi:MAG: RteC domain-containing protein [Saprospiraceae bacterium]|jgi:hypothetical protein
MLLQKLQGCVQDFDTKCQGYRHVSKLPIEVIKERMGFIKTIINELQEEEDKYTFQEKEEEIQYYKTDKPELTRYFYYYKKLLNIEARRPFGDKDYYQEALKQLKNDSLNIIDDIVYFRMQDSDSDEEWFVRNSTKVDIIAIIISSEMIEKYLEICLGQSDGNQFTPMFLLEWTRPKIEYVELVNFCNLIGCFNNGKASLDEIHKTMSHFWGVEINDIHIYTYELYRRRDPGKFAMECNEILKEKKQELINKRFSKGR